MAEAGFVHHDIKLENIALDNRDRVVLLDLGATVRSKDKIANHLGTIPYMAPEVLVHMDHTSNCDVWSAGVCLFVLLTGNFPYGNRREEVLEGIMNTDLETEYPWEEGVSTAARQACLAMLTPKPKHRPTAQEALRLPFFRRFARPTRHSA